MAASTRRQQAVQRGGLFSTPKASFSKETQELLKVMMQESKLTNFQQRKLKENMMNGQSLPAQCLPTSSKPGSGRPTRTSSHSSTSKGKKTTTGVQRGLRSKEVIQQISAESGPNYRPPPQKYDVSKEKQRLQNLMTYGSDMAPVTSDTHTVGHDTVIEEKDRFEEVVEEIEERRQFLSEMETLGQSKDYHSKIMTEISQRVRELETIDKERTNKLMSSQQT